MHGTQDRNPEQSLLQLGLEEIEERLEVSPLLAASDVQGLDREGHSCTCKIQPEPDDPHGDDGDG